MNLKRLLFISSLLRLKNLGWPAKQPFAFVQRKVRSAFNFKCWNDGSGDQKQLGW